MSIPKPTEDIKTRIFQGAAKEAELGSGLTSRVASEASSYYEFIKRDAIRRGSYDWTMEVVESFTPVDPPDKTRARRYKYVYVINFPNIINVECVNPTQFLYASQYVGWSDSELLQERLVRNYEVPLNLGGSPPPFRWIGKLLYTNVVPTEVIVKHDVKEEDFKEDFILYLIFTLASHLVRTSGEPGSNAQLRADALSAQKYAILKYAKQNIRPVDIYLKLIHDWIEFLSKGSGRL